MIKLKPFLPTIIGMASLVVLVSIPLAWDFARACFIILSFVAIGYLLKFRPAISKEQLLFGAPIILLFASAWVSHLVNDSPHRGPQFLIETYLLYLLGIPFLIFYSRYAPRLSIVWGSFFIATIAVGVSALYDFSINAGVRAGGSTGQAILFATISIALTATVIAGHGFFLRYKLSGRFALLIAIGFGGLAVLLSGARGVWLTFPILCLILLSQIEAFTRRQKVIAILIAILVIPVASYQVPYVKKRVDYSIDPIYDLLTKKQSLSELKSNASHKTENYLSINYRIELWASAIDIFSDNWIFGVGPGNYKKVMKDYVAKNNGTAKLPYLKHAHNQYLHSLMTKGLLGGLALVFMLACHLYIFIRQLILSSNSDSRALALAACAIIATFIVAGLTNAPMERKITLVFYVFSLSVLLGKIIHVENMPSSKDAT